MDGIVKSTCAFCSEYCGILVHVKDGRVTRVEGDPESTVYKGKLCPKGLASLEYLYHPDYLKRPLKRAGAKGEGKWQQISWSEALDTIANELIKARNNYGAESVVFISGARKGLHQDYMNRLANVFGTPNFCTASYVCYMPRSEAWRFTYGSSPFVDYDYPPACLVIWGSNVSETRPVGEYQQTIQALNRGSKLIVIDPRRTDLAERADLWIQPRPDSDMALALGMINVIVNERLYDKDFVENWTIGFDRLKIHIQNYSPEKVEEITWVPAEKIREVARFYAKNRPASIQSGNALDQEVNSFQANRALSILISITGNLGIPGGHLFHSTTGAIRVDLTEISLADKIAVDKRGMKLGASYMMPTLQYALPQMVTRAIIDEQPYPVHVAYVQASNPLVTWPNAEETYEALNRLHFLAVADRFMTPTASLADIVLPVASPFEFDTLLTPAYHPLIRVQQKVTEIGERWSDFRIINGLASRLGLGNYFWEDIEEFLDSVLKPSGLTFDELRKIGEISYSKQYWSYQSHGFATPSGKVEIYSNRLKEWGFDPLPIYHEPPETPYSDPAMVKEYPLIFTSWKRVAYRHSEGRQIASLRGSHPDPIVIIHPETASKLGIKEGDWVYIETKRGRIKQRASLSNGIEPGVVGVDYGWWFPERGSSGSYGWAESNINILTNNKPPFGREMGSANLKGMLCKVYKVC